MMGGYYGQIRIGDGIESRYLTVDGQIVCQSKKRGVKLVVETEGSMIRGHKWFKNGKLQEWERLGEFLRYYAKAGAVLLSYHPKSKRSLHGICMRHDQRFFGNGGTCKTRYSRGRFLSQEFRYNNRKLAFKIHHSDKQVTIKYPTGAVAAVISCPNGFATSAQDPEKRSYFGNGNHSCCLGEVYFQIDNKDKHKIDRDSVRDFDFSKDGNSKFLFYDRRGREFHKGEYRNRQRSGEWVLNGRSVFFLNGIAVDKKLWNTPQEKLKVSQILKISNAQMRSALLAKIGSERVFNECKHKVIHKTADMKLVEIPVKVDDGNGGRNSHMRILQVRCPSTKNHYYLSVPDFVWDGGKRTPLNQCELARQWTFGNDDPRKIIKFAKET
jgi:hypothetical protein